MSDAWVVVASSTHCRIFSHHKHNAPLEELEDLVHPKARLQDRELTSDKPGRTFDRHGPGRHSMGHAVDPSEQESVRFAKEVSERLEAGRMAKAFDRLVVVADPRFLGYLRQELSPATRHCVAKEIPKNLAEADPASIRDALPFRI